MEEDSEQQPEQGSQEFISQWQDTDILVSFILQTKQNCHHLLYLLIPPTHSLNYLYQGSGNELKKNFKEYNSQLECHILSQHKWSISLFPPNAFIQKYKPNESPFFLIVFIHLLLLFLSSANGVTSRRLARTTQACLAFSSHVL